MEQAFYELDAPVARVCSAEVPMPYPQHLEQAALPQPATVVAEVGAMIGAGAMAEFLMPSLGADMEAGTLLEWFVKPGDARQARRHRRASSTRARPRSRSRSSRTA